MKWLMVVLAFLGPVQALDDAARQWVLSVRSPAVERPARALTGIGKPLYVAATLAAIAVFDRRAGVVTATRAVLALAPVNLAVEGLKRATFRVRPDGTHKRSNAAFPSSHAANAFAIAIVFSRRWRRLTIPLFTLAAAVAASRMMLDRHWLSDVVVGAALGSALAWWVVRALERRALRGGGRPPDGGAAQPDRGARQRS